jgi:hypothetical protein
MNGSMSVARRWAMPVLLGGFALLPSLSRAADVGQRFPSIDAFVKSLPQGQANVAAGYGDLTGAGRRDWAGVVSLQDPDEGHALRVVVLSQQADGSYRLAAQGPLQTGDGGTGHHSLDAVDIKRGSVFVSWSWSWHGCAGGVTQQIKFYKDQWRMIGAEFNQSTPTVTDDGYDLGDSATLSNNLLTGAAVIHFKPLHRKEVTTTLKRAPSTVLLDDNFGEDSGSVDEFSKYAGC